MELTVYIKEWIAVLCIGYVLDLLLGDPHCIWHPVQGIGWFIQQSENILCRLFSKTKKGERTAGVLLVITTLLFSAGIPLGFLIILSFVHPYLRIIMECIMCYQLLATKSLRVESMKVYKKLREQDTEGARTAVSMIVGRDTGSLNDEGIAKAAVETVAENTSDGVIAPMIYMAIFGPIGGFFYKAVNTMDSMIGYKNDKYINLGFAAARLDDVLNFIPSRLCAYLLLGAAFFMRMDVKHAYAVFKRDRFNHASPNSAQTEAVCAGALKIQLAGDACYFGKLVSKPTIGDHIVNVNYEHIRMANKLLYLSSFFCILLIGVIGVIL